MGYYTGVYENKCPRCGEGDVTTTFISAPPMSYSEGCNNCGVSDFSDEEHGVLGEKLGTSYDSDKNEWVRFRWTSAEDDNPNDPAMD